MISPLAVFQALAGTPALLVTTLAAMARVG
jgi:hypothetical protein